jgi:hypothetical protein
MMLHNDYYEALERLKANKPEILTKGSYKINKDTVALEAGRKRGSIKPSREQFTDLIHKIDEVGRAYNNKALDKLKITEALAARYKHERDDIQSDYFAALNREMMLIRRLGDLEKQINKLEAEQKVIHIRS